MSGAIYVKFKDQGIEKATQAVQEDEAGNYDKALTLYLASLDYFKTYLKYEKNEKIKQTITEKVRGKISLSP
jgi:vacuolar protein-sorting-associated protein 4